MLSLMRLDTERTITLSASLRNFSCTDSASKALIDIYQGLYSTLMILRHRLKAKDNCPEIKIIKY